MSAPMAIDQSLDSLIKANKKQRPGRKTTEKKKVSSTSKAKKAAVTGKQKAAPAVAAPPAPPVATSNKINISNLPLDVKEPEIKDLFAKTVGPVREAQLFFDSKGQSKGIGSVVFQRKEDATKAVTMYNGRLIDGSRTMKVELVLQAGQAPAPATLSQRVAPAPAASAGKAAAPAAKKAGTTLAKKKATLRAKRAPRQKKKPVTAADLDAQMEDYTAAGAAAATA
ncbi:hypothetical protein FRB90_008614 [Tulasnella sp. 427]|nr:hypothetical protein FRB90_008614 [Tulasnella sp. 427]